MKKEESEGGRKRRWKKPKEERRKNKTSGQQRVSTVDVAIFSLEITDENGLSFCP